MMIRGFEELFEAYLNAQKAQANPRRLEMLERDVSGTVRMFKEVLWPVFRSFEGFELEHEFTSPTGVKMYVDALYIPYGFAFECEGFSVHAETITRERFNFEKSRVRTMLLSGYVYVPFTWDELDKKGQQCRSCLHELLGKYKDTHSMRADLSIYEREVIRYALSLRRPVGTLDLCECLGKKKDFVYRVIDSLISKGLLQSINSRTKRYRTYTVVNNGSDYIR
ncbi:hypothetical protein RB620_20680 [Paenibacillus sp. LHD-117]|uniref:hypothetical protein n=1 Tax=Paenibacillus sp. LHD-117 TaxID=3071412 RepID=UPI0027E0AAC1|nr:hypothetical protein [Paenibacillus sp. LHD-117]MDQ6421848.1 hypothetical protein [Paenibacillus sp. LHD-117]